MSENLFDTAVCNLIRVMHGGGNKDDDADAKAYIYISTEMDDEMLSALGIGNFSESPFRNRAKQTPLLIGPILEAMGSGELFPIEITDIDEAVTPFINTDGAKMVSAYLKKGDLCFSILVPLKTWDQFGELVAHAGKDLIITIRPGPMQEKLPLDDGKDAATVEPGDE